MYVCVYAFMQLNALRLGCHASPSSPKLGQFPQGTKSDKGSFFPKGLTGAWALDDFGSGQCPSLRKDSRRFWRTPFQALNFLFPVVEGWLRMTPMLPKCLGHLPSFCPGLRSSKGRTTCRWRRLAALNCDDWVWVKIVPSPKMDGLYLLTKKVSDLSLINY